MPASLPQQVGKAQSGNSSCNINVFESLSFQTLNSPAPNLHLPFFSFHTKNKSDLNWNFNQE